MLIEIPYRCERVCNLHNISTILKFDDKIVGDDFLKMNNYILNDKFHVKYFPTGKEYAYIKGFKTDIFSRTGRTWNIEFIFKSDSYLEIELNKKTK